MEKLLGKMVQSNEYCSVYDDIDRPKRFSFGCFIAFDSIHAVLKAYLPNGDFDGFQLIPIDSIFKIEKGDIYGKCMKQLIHDDDRTISIDRQQVCHSFLEYCNNESKLISITVSDDEWDAVGFIDSIEQGTITVRRVDEFGRLDGVAYLREDDITFAQCMSETEEKLSRLHLIDKDKVARLIIDDKK